MNYVSYYVEEKAARKVYVIFSVGLCASIIMKYSYDVLCLLFRRHSLQRSSVSAESAPSEQYQRFLSL